MSDGNEYLTSDRTENMRIEYGLVCSYHATAISWRFSILGFYMAATGLILSADSIPHAGILLAVLSLAMFMVDVRNRIAFHELIRRAGEIADILGTNSEHSRSAIDAGFHNRSTRIRILFFNISVSPEGVIAKLASHSLAIDIMILCVFAYGIFVTVR